MTIRPFSTIPGPVLYEADETDDEGGPSTAQGSVKYEGEIWLVERPVVTLQTATPMTQWGIWDCARSASTSTIGRGTTALMPDGKHKNNLVLNGLGELLDLFMKGNLVLQYKWSSRNLTNRVRFGEGSDRVAGGTRRTAASARSSGIEVPYQ